MPLVRFEVRNEVGLGDPDLYGGAAGAGKKGAAAAAAGAEEEPKALLEGVAVAGLVGILRQLGDLAEFAADVFHDLHEQVIATSARGRKVLTRVQNIEAALPSLEKAVKSQKSHIHFAYVPGSDWHTQLQNEQNHLLSSDLPRFMMDSYEECRDPPRLYLLDKFDNAGAGACLKRYSDPSYFKKAWDMMSADKNTSLRREKRSQKIKIQSLLDFPMRMVMKSHQNDKLQKRSVSSSPILLNGTTVNDLTDSLKQGSLPDDMVARSPSVKWDEKAAIITSTSINHHDEIPGEADNYLDALNTLESETETEAEFQTKNQVIAAPSFNAIAPQVDTVDDIVSQHPDSSVLEFPGTCQNSDMPCTSERTTDIPDLSNEDPLEVSQVAFSDHTAVLPRKGSSAISIRESDAQGSCGDPSDISEPILQVHTAVSLDERSLGSNNVPESKAADDPGDFPNISEPELSVYAVIPSNKESSAPNQVSDSNTEGACDNFIDDATIYQGSRPTNSNILTDKSVENAFAAKSSPGDTTGDSCVVSESRSAPHDDPGKNQEDASEVSDFQSDCLDEPLENRCASVDISPNSSSISIGLSSVKLWTNAGLFGLEPSKPPVFGSQDGPRENSGPGSREPQQVPSSEHTEFHSSKPTESAVLDASNGNTSITSSFVGKLVGIRPGSANSISSGANQSAAIKPDSVHSQTDGPSDCSSSFEHNVHKNSIGKHASISELLESEGNAEHGSRTYSSTDIDGRNNMHMVSASSFSSIAQRFLANTLQRRTSPKYNDISASARVNTDASANDQSNLNHVAEQSESVFEGSQFEKNTENGMNGFSKSSIFSSRRYSEKSSPPLEYMKISFHPMSSFEMSKMNLDLCDGNFNEISDDMMLPTFQLLSESSVPQPGSGSESEDDTFGRSYSYSSYDDLSPRLYSNSEVWDQEDGAGLEEHELYDDSNQSAAPISSYMEFEQMNLSGMKSAVSLADQNVLGTLEPHTVEELPNFDTLMSRSVTTTASSSTNAVEDDETTNSLEEGITAKDMFRETSSLPHEHTSAQEEHLPPVAPPAPQGHAKCVDIPITDGVNGNSSLPGTVEIKSSLLQQIRDKTFNLRRTNASKTDTSSQSTANSSVVAILEKANAIRQAVASEDGCDDDNWSDI
ncbi:hypothetical protein PR202_ga24128 [Eleusine coracana subsp. coracana]|uniref:Protein SCAR n=1 Tax=Eleusine coracana subsp. coracana TaxID=191504 RepID=A0AAV5D8N0_ELECO|nr:hypothetical protein PR202_ga24128 [Eleusine coracana subsp. coracana]